VDLRRLYLPLRLPLNRHSLGWNTLVTLKARGVLVVLLLLLILGLGHLVSDLLEFST
jgi:hypothetical protein